MKADNVDVIVSISYPATLACKVEKAPTVVAYGCGDPVATHLIEGMARPGDLCDVHSLSTCLLQGAPKSASAYPCVGTLFGLGTYHTFFFIVVPIMAGGIGEGAIRLSVGSTRRSDFCEFRQLRTGPDGRPEWCIRKSSRLPAKSFSVMNC
jgi:hypothetical protein